MNKVMHFQKPMPEIDKRKKSTDEVKDEGYWQFRKRNNMAAKQSRDLHKAKVDQTVKEIGILKKKNMSMIKKISMVREESLKFTKLLEKHEALI